MDAIPVFRQAKKRKVATPVQQDVDQPSLDQRQEDNGYRFERSSSNGDENDPRPAVRSMKHDRFAKGGISFKQLSRSRSNVPDNVSMAPVPAEASTDVIRDMSNRFTGATGQVVDVDNHMMAYIDSEMAKRRQASTGAHSKPTNTDIAIPDASKPQPAVSSRQNNLHQLTEVDLGPSTTADNQARTTLAISRAQTGTPSAPPEDAKPRKPLKPRLGRDGKPLRPRPRRRRPSEDIARDALVEQVLHEHKVDTAYQPDAPYHEAPKEENNDAAADADEAFAEKFRQEFLDQVAERKRPHAQKQKSAAGQAGGGAGAAPEKAAPKLGGSRSSRAKLAAQQAQGHGQGQAK